MKAKVYGFPLPDRPPRTEAELRQLIDRLEDPEEMARWLEQILNPEKPTLENNSEQQGRLQDV